MAITLDERDGVLHASMLHPPTNALDQTLVAALTELVERFARGGARVLVLSSGIPDVFATSGISFVTAEELADYRDALRRPLERLAACRRPSLAVLSGQAVDGGLELAMACTLRICAPGARLGFPDINRGLIPAAAQEQIKRAAGGTQRLPRLVGPGRALDLLLSGREIAGEEAWRIGLAERLSDGDPVTDADALAASLARASASAVEAIVGCVDASRSLPDDRGMAVEGAALLSIFDDDTRGAANGARSSLLARP
jgi:enoyl-CoA hydratase